MKRFVQLSIVLCCFLIAQAAYGEFEFLEVDGLTVHIDEIIFRQGYGDGSETVADIQLDQSINLTDDLSDVFSEGFDLRLNFGFSELEFDTIMIWMSGGVGIKGHAYLESSGRHVYTSNSGIQLTGVTGSTWSPPADYGYYQTDYMYYPDETGEGQNETTHLSEMRAYAIDLPIDLSLLVDTYMVAYYWDGTDADRHGFVSTVPMESPGTFPTGTPVINITYLPFYVTVNQNVVSETYVITDETNFLAGKLGTAGTELTDIDEKTVMFMTLTFDEDDGSFYIGRTANWDGLNMGGSFYLSQFVKTASYDAGLDEYTLNFSEWDEQSGWNSAEQVLGFSRSSAVWDMGTATLEMANGSTQTMHFKRVK